MARLVPALVLGFAFMAGGAESPVGQLVALPEPGWPQWRGPRRDGISTETGLLKVWPQQGPKRLWEAGGLGTGYSAPIVVAGTIYITGDVDEELCVFALDLNGQRKWQASNGKSWKGSYPGSRASCTYAGGRLYHMNAHGRAACLDAATGREIWAVETHQRFDARNIPWAIAESLLVDGNKVIVTPGGKKAVMAALDRDTGQTLWTSGPLMFERTSDVGGRKLSTPRQDADRASYASPILIEMAGRRMVVGCSGRHLICVDAENGNLLWAQPMHTRYEVLGITPVLYRDSVFMTGPDGDGGKLFRLVVGDSDVRSEEIWRTSLDTCHGGVLVLGDMLYGSWYRPPAGWGCVDLATGKTVYQTRELAMGSAIWADGRLYVLTQEGVVALVDPAGNSFRIVSQFHLIDQRKTDVWTHPVILNGRLYLRYHDTLYCYDIQDRSGD